MISACEIMILSMYTLYKYKQVPEKTKNERSTRCKHCPMTTYEDNETHSYTQVCTISEIT